MPGGIRIRIALLTGGLLALLFLALGVFLYASLSNQLYQLLEQNLKVRAEQILPALLEDGEAWSAALERSGSEADDEDLLRLVAPDGRVLAASGLLSVPIPEESVQQGGFFTLVYNDSVDEEPNDEADDLLRLYSLPVVRNGTRIAYLQVGQDLEPIQQTLDRLLALLVLSGPLIVLLAAGAGYWLAGQTLAPIEAIRSRAAAIGARDLSQRIDFPLPNDEVGRLAETFNDMLERLEKAFQRQRRFTADASHELRTPLSIMQGEIDVTLEKPRSTDEYQRSLRSIGDEVRWMGRLVSDLLLLARSDSAELELEVERFDLAELLAILVEQMAQQAEAAAVDLIAKLPASLIIEGDRDRLLQVFINLLQNAFTYAEGSRVTVEAVHKGESALVSISDTGPGIDADHLPHLFERFYRIDRARGRKRPGSGSGLGLAIAQEIVHAHDGALYVDSKVGAGSRFSVSLPCVL